MHSTPFAQLLCIVYSPQLLICCAGVSPLIQSASTLGRRESSSSLREGLDHTALESAAANRPGQSGTHTQPPPASLHAAEDGQSLEGQCKSASDALSGRSSDHDDGLSHGTPEVLSADEWGDFDFDHS